MRNGCCSCWRNGLLLACLMCGLSRGGEYVRKESWRETVVVNLGAWSAETIVQTMADFPKNRLELEAVADWLVQDGIEGNRLDGGAVCRVLDGFRPAPAALRAKMNELESAGVPVGDARWAELYLAACEARRDARLRAHRERLQRIVFTKHYDMGGSHYAYTEGQSDAQNERHFQPGSALCVLEIDGIWGQVRTLLDDPGGVIRDPDVSYDGQRILFAWKKSLDEDDYHLYEMKVEEGKARQITSGLGFADYEGAYLPNGDLIFNSTRCVQTVDCWWTEVSNLFTCDANGRYLRQLCFDQVHDNFPTVTHDGRVIYTRWDYSDRGQMYPQGLFQMNPDGTGQTEVYGNNSWFPTTVLHARAIPGTSKIVCIFTGHHTLQKGWLGILDPRRGRQENEGAQLIAPVRETRAERIDEYGQSGDQFQYPYPLSETEFLVAFRREGAPRFGIYLVAIDGQRELLATDTAISCNQPIPLAPRPVPAVRPNLVDYREPTATVYMQDVYLGAGLRGIARGTIRELRVVAMEFRAAGVGENGNSGLAGWSDVSTPVSIEGTWDVKKIVGTATVHKDGSACFVVPSRTPLYFQALDGRGRMVQSMRSWVTLQPGESVSCIGCHESKNTTPWPARFTEAMAAGAEPLRPFYGPTRGFSFIREIQPILDRHCVSCHHLDERPAYAGQPLPEGEGRGDGEAASNDASALELLLQPAKAREGFVAARVAPRSEVKPAFSLKGKQTLEKKSERKWSDSYRALADRHVANWINVQSAPPMLPPYHTGAARSRLMTMLEDGKHYGVVLSKPELDRVVAWIDLLVPYCGDFTEAMNEEVIPRYRHFLDKRLRWQAEEARNIADYLHETRSR